MSVSRPNGCWDWPLSLKKERHAGEWSDRRDRYGRRTLPDQLDQNDIEELWSPEREYFANGFTTDLRFDLLHGASAELIRLGSDLRDSTDVSRALMLLCYLGFRSARCVGVLLASGYGPEALPHVRRLEETAERASWLTEDQSGERARAWLAGRSRKKPRSLVGVDSWDYLSPSAHADPANFGWLFTRTGNLAVAPDASFGDPIMCLAAALHVKQLGYVVSGVSGSSTIALDRLASDIDEALRQEEETLQ